MHHFYYIFTTFAALLWGDIILNGFGIASAEAFGTPTTTAVPTATTTTTTTTTTEDETIQTTTTTTTTHISLCHLISNVANAHHIDFTLRYYADNFSYLPETNEKIEWDMILLSVNPYQLENPLHTPTHNTILAWTENYHRCDALIGPAASLFSLSLSPLVSMPWISHSASSTELSDKECHPTFSRMIPDDNYGGTLIAKALRAFGWDTLATLCMFEPFGTSVTEGVRAAFEASGGRVVGKKCVPISVNATEMAVAVSEVMQHTRILFFGGGYPINALKILDEALDMAGLKGKVIVITSENWCSFQERGVNFSFIDGQLCGAYHVDKSASKLNEYIKAYNERNFTAVEDYLLGAHFESEVSGDRFIVNEPYSYFAHDAVLHMMSSMFHFYKQHPGSGGASDGPTTNNRRTDPTAVIDFLRQHRTSGFTGNVLLNEKGNREMETMVIYNAHPGAKLVPVGVVSNSQEEGGGGGGGFIQEPGSTFYILNSTYDHLNELPSTLSPSGSKDGPSLSATTIIISLAVFAAAIIITVVLTVGFMVWRKHAERRKPPTDDTEQFTALFIDIHQTQKIQLCASSRGTDSIGAHLLLHEYHAVLRTAIAKFGGTCVAHITRDEGKSLFVFRQAIDAVRFSCHVQRSFVSRCDQKEPLHVRIGINTSFGCIYETQKSLLPSPFATAGDGVITVKSRPSTGNGNGNVGMSMSTLNPLSVSDATSFNSNNSSGGQILRKMFAFNVQPSSPSSPPPLCYGGHAVNGALQIHLSARRGHTLISLKTYEAAKEHGEWTAEEEICVKQLPMGALNRSGWSGDAAAVNFNDVRLLVLPCEHKQDQGPSGADESLQSEADSDECPTISPYHL